MLLLHHRHCLYKLFICGFMNNQNQSQAVDFFAYGALSSQAGVRNLRELKNVTQRAGLLVENINPGSSQSDCRIQA